MSSAQKHHLHKLQHTDRGACRNNQGALAASPSLVAGKTQSNDHQVSSAEHKQHCCSVNDSAGCFVQAVAKGTKIIDEDGLMGLIRAAPAPEEEGAPDEKQEETESEDDVAFVSSTAGPSGNSGPIKAAGASRPPLSGPSRPWPSAAGEVQHLASRLKKPHPGEYGGVSYLQYFGGCSLNTRF